MAVLNKNITEQISPDGTPIAQPAKPVAPPIAEAPVETPVQPEAGTETKPDAAEEAVLDINDFLSASGKQHEGKKDDKAPIETKPEPVPDGATKPDSGATPIASKAKSVARDYSDIEDGHKQAFERMSNEAFNLLKPIYLERKQLAAKQAEVEAQIAERDAKITQLQSGKPQIPDSYYEHENAFILTPEFNEVSSNINAYNLVLNHWQSQLDGIRSASKESYTEIHQNPQTGEFYQSAPLPVDAHTEQKLSSYVHFAQQKMIEAKAELNLMAKSHKAKVADTVNWVRNFEATGFKNFETDAALQAIVKDTISKLPRTFHANPLAPLVAKALVTINQLGKLLQAKAQPASAAATTTTTPKAGNGNLTAAELAGEGGGGKPEVGEVTMEDFKRAKE